MHKENQTHMGYVFTGKHYWIILYSHSLEVNIIVKIVRSNFFGILFHKICLKMKYANVRLQYI